jgi:cytoskeletal protein RodZ
MKSVGQVLKRSRQKKKLSVEKLSQITKIKPEFISSMESQSWDKLPDYPVVSGFVDKIAKAVDQDPEKVKAFLRRDYPPKNINPNPKPDLKLKITWSPKLTFAVGIFMVIVGISSYLIYQIKSFNKPPDLEVANPQQQEIIKTSKIFITGKTDEDATVRVNNQQIYVDEYGNFSGEIDVYEKTKQVEVVATSRSGRQTVVVRDVEVKLE